MRASLSLVTVAALLGAASPAGAQGAALLEPSSDWNLDFGEERCALYREFGTGDSLVRLQIQRFGPFSEVRFLLAGAAIPESQRPMGEVSYRFGQDTRPRGPLNSLNGRACGVPAVSFSGDFAPMLDLSPTDLAQLTPERRSEVYAANRAAAPAFQAAIDRMSVELGDGRRLDLDLGTMAAPLESMDICLADLVSSWGLDPAVVHELSRPPVPDPASVARIEARYPRSAARQDQSAFVPVRVMVDEEGRATECVIQNPGVEPAFRRAVCDGLATRFSPALDRAGNPVAAVYATSVVYQVR